MLPYTAAIYTNQLQQAALSYQQNRPPTPVSSLQLATLNFDRLRYGFASMQSQLLPNVSTSGGCVGPNQAQGGSPVAGGYPPTVFQHAAAAAGFDPMTLAAAGFRHAFDPRTGRFLPPEEPKPQHSYIGLIAMAILSNSEKKMVLSDIYQWILDHYAYFRSRGPGWRNSIRHNLSLNDCFIKAGRSANGKGHYWAIHPANVEDFKKGDFRRRRAQRKVRKHMGLSVPDDEDDSDDSPCSSPVTVNAGTFFGALPPPIPHPAVALAVPKVIESKSDEPQPKRKRLFDMESLLSNSDEKRAIDCTIGNRSDEKTEQKPPASSAAIPNPFFFPPPIPHASGSSAENGQFLAAMAAAAGFMPFAFVSNGVQPPNIPWLCPPAFMPPPGNPYFWNQNANTSSPRPNSKNPSASPPSNSNGGETANGDNPMQIAQSGDSNERRTPSPQDTAAQWQETFAKIMARSYQGRNYVKCTKNSFPSPPNHQEKDEDEKLSPNTQIKS